MPKHQKAHKNKYSKKSITARSQEDFEHSRQRSRNYYQFKLPGKGKKFGKAK